jgi:hypothetical protein
MLVMKKIQMLNQIVIQKMGQKRIQMKIRKRSQIQDQKENQVMILMMTLKEILVKMKMMKKNLKTVK